MRACACRRSSGARTHLAGSAPVALTSGVSTAALLGRALGWNLTPLPARLSVTFCFVSTPLNESEQAES